jgi:IclR family acetate operon transcriptional repressor
MAATSPRSVVHIDDTSDTPYSVRAVMRVLDIFDLLKTSIAGATLTDVVNATGLPKSSAFRYLATLEARRYVERDANSGTYQLGLAFFPVEGRHLEAYADFVRPHLEELRDRYDETVNLGILKNGHITYIDVAESRQPMRFHTPIGKRGSIHSTALGKAISSQRPEDEIRRILQAAGMPAKTDRTITNPDEFVTGLAEVRRRGYAVDNGEDNEGCRCIGVPIADGPFPAAISLSAPSARLAMKDVPEIAGVMMKIAGGLSRGLGARAKAATSV